MIHEESSAVAVWDAPAWAASSLVVDQAAIEHRLQLGDIDGLDREEGFDVGVVQRDELLLRDDTASVARTTAQVSVAGVRLSAEQAKELAALLTSAAEVIRTAA